MKQQNGLSLIELMISITLGLMLMLGVLNVFLGSKGAFVSQQAISRIQESGRFAIDYMNKEIRMAGFVGCASNVDASSITNHLVHDADEFPWSYGTIVKGYTDADATDLGLTDLVSGTDVLEVVSASGGQALVTAATSATGIPVDVAEKAGGCGVAAMYGDFCVGDILVISNCQRADIFKAGALSTTSIAVASVDATTEGANATDLTGATFNEGAEVIKMRKLLFYIKNNTAGTPSLWLSDNGTSTELVEGVEDMAVQYGIDTNDDDVPDGYETEDDVADADWVNVKSVHLEILVRTPEDRVLPEPQKFTFPLDAASPTTPADRVMRQVFVSTVAVRSRLN